MSRRWWAAVGLLFLAVGLPQLWFAQTEWVYDDRAILGQNRVVHDADYQTIWTTPYWSGVPSVYQKDNLHRPLFLSLAALLDGHPDLLRFCVFLSHCLVGALLGLAAFQLVRGWKGLSDQRAAWIAWAVAAFFLVQPAAVEVTAQGIGLMETMPCLLGFAALLLLSRRPGWAVAVVALAPGWKETGYIWMALVAGALAVQRRYRFAVLTGALALGWLGLRVFVYGSLFSSRVEPFALLNPMVDMDFTDAWLTRVALLGHYLRLVLMPWDLSCDYSRGTLPMPGYLLQIWFLLGAGGLAWLFYRRDTLFRADRLLLWGPLLTILPVLHLASPAGVIFAERFGYAFSAGVLLCALWVLGPRWLRAPERTRRFWLAGLALLTLADYGRMALRHRDWISGESLFFADSRNYPYNAKLHFNYAVSLGQQRRWQGARDELLRAVTIEPNFPDAHYRLSLAYRELGDTAAAKIHHDVAVQLGNTPAEREPAELNRPGKE